MRKFDIFVLVCSCKKDAFLVCAVCCVMAITSFGVTHRFDGTDDMCWTVDGLFKLLSIPCIAAMRVCLLMSDFSYELS